MSRVYGYLIARLLKKNKNKLVNKSIVIKKKIFQLLEMGWICHLFLCKHTAAPPTSLFQVCVTLMSVSGTELYQNNIQIDKKLTMLNLLPHFIAHLSLLESYSTTYWHIPNSHLREQWAAAMPLELL